MAKPVLRRNLWPNPRGLAESGLGGVAASPGATVEQVVFADKGIPDLVLPDGGRIATGFRVLAPLSNEGVRLTSIPVENGATYTVSAYAYVVSGSVDAQIVGRGNGSDLVTPGVWQRVTFTSMVNTDTASFAVRGAVNGSEFYCTLVLVEQASEALPPFDGDGYVNPATGLWTPDPLHKRVAWEGTENASPSVMYRTPMGLWITGIWKPY